MKPELFHRWYDPYSSKIRNFITENNLESQVDYVEVDEDDLASSRLVHFTGKDDVPCLLVGDEAIFEYERIISWMKDHLLGRGETAIT